jgi:nucleotide-binding universal stress UspA family protein
MPVGMLGDESAILVDFKEEENKRQERQESARRYLDELASRLERDGTEFKVEVLWGRVAERLVDFAAENQVDLVLIATHGRSGVSRWVRGSIADRILRSCHAPVLMVRAPGAKGGV